jgi:predicted metal-binding membrane protein
VTTSFTRRVVSARSDAAWILAALATPAWAALLLVPLNAGLGPLCFGGAVSLPALTRGAFHVLAATWGGALTAWALMTAAMAPLMVYPMARYIWARSFPERRVRGLSLFVAAYLLVCAAAAVVITLALGLADARSPSGRVGWLTLALAAAWEITPGRQNILRRCHRAWPLPPGGRRADVACTVMGLHHGAICALTCLPMMTAAHTAGPLAPVCMMGVAGLTLWERHMRRPRPVLIAGLLVAGVLSAQLVGRLIA